MFEKKSLVFYYCTTPLHMGAGTSVGAIDNPIQREVHSKHPVISGSGLKGAIRHHVTKQWQNKDDKDDIVSLFGSETSSGELTAGAISFTDANLVAFPVRSLKNTFVYVTCPYVLARLKRMAILAGLSLEWDVTGLAGIGVTAAGDDAITSDGKLCLEALEFSCKNNKTTNDIANWLADNCLSGDENEYFQEKIRSDLFVVSDDDFSYFVRNSTVVEPHVRIDDKTGTADGGALFYTENLPPESILCGIVLASVERGNKENKKDAETCLKKILWNENTGISGQLIQMGGDSTTGRGLVFVNAIKGE